MLKTAKSLDSHLTAPPVVTKAHWRKPSHVSSFSAEAKHAKCLLQKQLPVNSTSVSHQRKKNLAIVQTISLELQKKVWYVGFPPPFCGYCSCCLKTLIANRANTEVPFVLIFA